MARREANHQCASSTSAMRGYRLGSIALAPLFLEAPAIAHQVQGPSLDLAVHARKVLADDAERDELHAAEEEHRDHQRRIPGQIDATNDLQADQKKREKKGEERTSDANVAPDFERHRTERGDGVEGKVPQAPVAPLGIAGVARLP